ncbi:MAG: sigma-E processing peptidase SpoIIGA [Alicyclobacillus sp.]|nr:sigma-E processing peptidase SpoIIGA [Alicyclobacillus sp.]
MPVVYADVVWLVNFVMDAALLAITCWIGKRRLRPGRISAGALIGSLYSLTLFLPPLSTLTTWPGKAVLSLLMVAVAIPWRSWLDLARLCALFYLVAFVMAGAAIALHFAIPGVSAGQGWIVSGSRLAIAVSMQSLCLLLAVPLSAALIQSVLRRVRQARLDAALTYTIRVEVGAASVELTGLLDTGNRLRDPISRCPVCVADAEAVAPLLPQPLRSAAERSGDLLGAVSGLEDQAWVRRITLVPYQSAGQRQTLAVAFRPDRVSFAQAGRWHEASGRCLFALRPGRLSADRSFQAIVHSELITGDDGFEDDRAHTEPERSSAYPPAAVVDPNPSEAWRRA